MHNYLVVFEEPNFSTNMPMAELKSLLEMEFGQVKVESFDLDTIVTSTETYSHDRKKIETSLSEITLYPLEQTCVISSEDQLEKETLFKVVRNSGYIHSMGDLVTLGRWDFYGLDDLVSIANVPLPDDTSLDIQFLTKGTEKRLSSLEIDTNRFFFDDIPLHWQIEKMEGLIKKKETSKKLKLQILKDTHHGPLTEVPEGNDTVMLLGYIPAFKKVNPLHDLDDNLPYWKGKCTTPRRLMAAMLNVVGLKTGGTYLDMFGGTGTSMIEATKVGPVIALHGDIMEVIGAKDNYRFLTMNPEEVKEFNDKLSLPFGQFFKHGYKTLQSMMSIRGLGYDKAHPEIHDIDEQEFPDFQSRINYYFMRKMIQLHISSNAASEFWFQNVVRIKDFYKSIRGHQNKLKEYQRALARHFVGGQQQLLRDEYGVVECIALPKKGFFITGNMDATNLKLSDNSIDGIVTDPPYGYATDHDNEGLESLYEGFIREGIRVLKSGGSMALCTLDTVRTGRYVDPKLTSTGVKETAKSIACEMGITLTTLDSYYWKSTHVLNRGIVSFTVQK